MCNVSRSPVKRDFFSSYCGHLLHYRRSSECWDFPTDVVWSLPENIKNLEVAVVIWHCMNEIASN